MEEVAKLSWLAVLLTFSTFYLNICECFFFCGKKEFGRKRTTSDFYSKRVLLIGMFIYTASHPPKTRLPVCVVVQDGTARVSVVLQIAAVDPAARKARLLQFCKVEPSRL